MSLMEQRRPILDMTPEGEFRGPPPPSRLDRVMAVALRWALLVGGIALLLTLAALSVMALTLLLPVLFGAALIAGAILWWRGRRPGPEGRSGVRIVIFRR